MIKPYCVPVPGAEMIRECYHAGVWWDDLNEFRDSGFFSFYLRAMHCNHIQYIISRLVFDLSRILMPICCLFLSMACPFWGTRINLYVHNINDPKSNVLGV